MAKKIITNFRIFQYLEKFPHGRNYFKIMKIIQNTNRNHFMNLKNGGHEVFF
jgi:hypothetical protein